mmetsp:Transcript_92391/g.188026  ORF Transcript_92391/g.188026 Transcript_92391/m.188026 type:complete len:277 (+) Transcript_92391:788-1618(+)
MASSRSLAVIFRRAGGLLFPLSCCCSSTSEMATASTPAAFAFPRFFLLLPPFGCCRGFRLVVDTAFFDFSLMTSRTAWSAAQFKSSFRSLPEYPTVLLASSGKNFRADSSIGCPLFSSVMVRIWYRPFASGRSILNNLGRRLRIALSTWLGRLVAPKTMTGPPLRLPSWLLLFPEVVIPSQSVRNSALMAFPALFSAPSRGFKKVSSSSIKMIDGESLRARLKIASMSLLDSPYHLFMIFESLTARKVASASLAIALASMVFPVPGGPYNKIPPGA